VHIVGYFYCFKIYFTHRLKYSLYDNDVAGEQRQHFLTEHNIRPADIMKCAFFLALTMGYFARSRNKTMFSSVLINTLTPNDL
jgi:hypothetical protein